MTTTTTAVLQDRETLRLCTAGSVDDGKSTFVGRLLHDTKSVLADQLASVERTSADRGFDGLDLSLLVDGLRAEREQGITIDVAYRYFATDKRTFILADTPGHVQYTRNTVTGVSTSQVVVLLVDARNGILPQTIKHLKVAALMGVRTVILAVNKIDLVSFDQNVFEAIASQFIDLAVELGISDPNVVPVSALLGDNVVEPSDNTPWYHGPTVLELLETIPVGAGRATNLGFRFPVQYVIREHTSDYRGYAGRITAGRVNVGDIVYLGGGLSSTVAGIDTAEGPASSAETGDSVTLLLADNIDLARGDLIAGTDRPAESRTFDVTLVGLHEQPLREGETIKIRYGSALVRGRIATLENPLELNDISDARVELASPLPVEAYAARGAVGNLLVVDKASGDTRAAGLVR
ncbi:Bifunctional enzyme CysN/CysC [Corynebacterium kalinowskii]|uniref:sulfate adenylyltransferase n=1 Tax=Corynebacterium kalinowskii TaxID=2675216 RepID=A0A6B8VJ55_9CORY|nr:GTP-binding protein [Corynebacterium kalinowskii]QGU01504.1 Bifunctional enzyme CysN/CysC [Corynebacterium kalinowskii]